MLAAPDYGLTTCLPPGRLTTIDARLPTSSFDSNTFFVNLSTNLSVYRKNRTFHYTNRYIW
jgi:hypothetical protein